MHQPGKLYLSALLESLRMHPLAGQILSGVNRQLYAPFADLNTEDMQPVLQKATAIASGQVILSSVLADKPLRSIFSAIGTNNAVLGETPLPDKDVWMKNFQQDLQRLPAQNDAGIFAEQLLYILEKFCTDVPSGYHPAVSLYDFTKTQAACAQCINESIPSEKEPFLLISGGVSGIQDYLYNIVSRKASKNLKGRSFFVQLLADTIVLEVLLKLKLFRANIVYASGAGFLLLAPNTPQNNSGLEELKKDLTQRLFTEFKTSIFLELESFSISGLDTESLSDGLKKLNELATESKKRKFSTMFGEDGIRIRTDENSMESQTGYSYFFEPLSVDGNEDRDAITGEEIFNDGENLDDYDDEGEILVKKLTKHQVKLAELLPNTKALVMGQFDTNVREWTKIAPAGGDIQTYLITDDSILQVPEDTIVFHQQLGKKAVDLSLQGFGVRGVTLYAGNLVPKYNLTDRSSGKFSGNPKMFEDLANDGLTRFNRLGILRMDVDGLGSTFKNLFNKAKNPDFPQMLAGYSALSRSLDYFFKDHLNRIWESDQEFRDYVQIVYAGGDDLFIVGKWNSIIRMAEIIRAEFGNWICKNQTIGLSGGIELVTSKFPIIKAVEKAATGEDKAKDHWFNGKKGNSITLFGLSLEWDSEFKEVKRLKNIMVDLSTDGSLPRGFFTKIQGLYEQKKFQVKKERTESWRWRIAYDFTRMKERKRNSSELKNFLDMLMKSVISDRSEFFVAAKDSHDYFTLVNLAANWADFETRSKEKQIN